jgi:hypothetical protein
MSGFTPCNLCSLRQMQNRAAKRGATVVLELVIDPPLAGWTAARYSDAEKPTQYFLQLPEECVC